MGVGAGIAIALLTILSLALFVVSVVFYGKYKDASEQLGQANSDYAKIVSPIERNSEQVQRLLDLARNKGRNTTLVSYLTDELGGVMNALVGDRNYTLEQFQADLKANYPDAVGSPLMNFVKAQHRKILEEQDHAADLEASLEDLRNRLDEEAQRYAELNEKKKQEIAEVKSLVGTYSSNVEQYDANLRDTISDMQTRIDDLIDKYESQLASIRAELDASNEKVIILQGQLATLRQEAASSTVKGRDEYALVDATVLSTNASNQTVTIDRGRKHNIVLGMNFEVYADPSLIVDSETGKMLRGKATIEIIKVDDQTSTARIIRYSVANPVLEGDSCANPVYDPNKRYRFLVYGEFDTDFDGRTTAHEADDIKALIQQWGGIIVDSIEDNVDFLVLGEKPYVGPAPAPDVPFPVIAKWQEEYEKAKKYDDLFNTAKSTSIPILNQNRLFTLTGYFER